MDEKKRLQVMEHNAKRGFLICLLASLLVSYQFMVQIVPGLMVNELAQGMHISLAQVGFLSSAMFYSYLILQGPCGAFAQRVGPRFSLLLAALGIPVSCLIFACSQNYTIAIAGRLLAGVFAAPCVVSCFILGSRWLPEHLFASLCGIVEMMGMLGAAVGPVFISGCLTHYGWQKTMFLVASIGLVLLLLIFLVVRNSPKNAPEVAASESGANRPSENIKGLAGLKVLLKTPGYLSCCLFGFFTFSILNSFGGLWLIPFAKTLYTLSSGSAGLLMTFTFAGAAGGILLVSSLTTSVSARRLMLTGTVLCLLLLPVILFVSVSFNVLLLLSFALGVSSGVYLLPFSMIKQEVPHALCGLALGMANAIIIGSGLVFQPLIGWLLSTGNTHHSLLTVQNYQIALLPLLAGLLAAMWLAVRTKETVQNKERLVIVEGVLVTKEKC